MTTAAPDKNRGVRRENRPSSVLFGSLVEHGRGRALAGPSVRGYADDSSGPPKASGATVTAPESYIEARVTEPKAPDPPTEANTETVGA